MTKKLFITFLMVSWLAVGSMGVSAQAMTEVQPVVAPAPLLPLISSTDTSTIAEVDLQPGTKSPHVRKIQETLKAMGYLPADLETTEYLGPKTKDAIMNFQRAQGISPTGFLGQATRAALRKNFRGSGEVIDRNVDIVCMKTEVEKRENALLSAYDTHAGKLKIARETRKTDFLAAWSIQDPKARHTALKTAWEKYRQSVKTAANEWNISRKTTWTQFAQQAKSCKATAAETQDLEKVEVAE